MNDYPTLYAASHELLVLQDVLEDNVGRALQTLLALLARPQPVGSTVHQAYVRLFRLLAEEAALYNGELVGDAWQNHLLDRLLSSNNVIAQRLRYPFMSEEIETDEEPNATDLQDWLGNSLLEAARYDLLRLHSLYNLNITEMALLVSELHFPSAALPSWDKFKSNSSATKPDALHIQAKRSLSGAANWSDALGSLLYYYHYYDPSDFRQYNAFRWIRDEHGNFFEPVAEVDEQHFEQLVGYEREKQAIIANTEQFLAGLPANHVLLYGARGTGKSSTVKALLPRYSQRGLRLIEVHKSELGDYLAIVRAVRGRPEKFILFVDDLSFEPEELSYKDLKALLEGSLEARPANLLIYATSNRRHLIKEQFSDNARPGDEEVNAWDSVEEKISLSDRFGLIVTFIAPNQPQYLAIVDKLAAEAGIELEPEDLHRRALRWELSHSGRSGRTARQFINQLSGELRLKKV